MKMKSLLLALGLGLIGQPGHAEIVVGFVTGLSGPVSSIGIPNSKGIKAGELLQGEIGGQKVRIIQLDDASNPTASTQNARKLVEEDHVDLLIGEAVAVLVREKFLLRTVALSQPKGKTRPLEIFTVLDQRNGAAEPAWLTAYEEGVRRYRQRDAASA